MTYEQPPIKALENKAEAANDQEHDNLKDGESMAKRDPISGPTDIREQLAVPSLEYQASHRTEFDKQARNMPVININKDLSALVVQQMRLHHTSLL